MIERMIILAMWVAAMSGVIGIICTLQCTMSEGDAWAIRMAYIGGAGYTAAAACGWHLVSRKGG